MNFIIRLLITAVVAYGLAHFLPAIHIPDFKDALIFALVLAVLNAIVKPLLILLTLPATILTLGLFLFVINAIIILIADKALDGVKVDGFLWALIFSLILSTITSLLQAMITEKD